MTLQKSGPEPPKAELLQYIENAKILKTRLSKIWDRNEITCFLGTSCLTFESEVITPTKAYSAGFISDGTSTTVEFDCSVLPIGDDFKGAQPTNVLSPAATSVFTGSLSGVTAVLNGTTVTMTFVTPPPKFDNSSNLVLYTATFILEFAD